MDIFSLRADLVEDYKSFTARLCSRATTGSEPSWTSGWRAPLNGRIRGYP